MPVPTPELDWEIGNGIFRAASINSTLRLAPKTGQLVPFITPCNTDGTQTLPTGYTGMGGLGTVGVIAAVKTTAGVPADTDYSGATPAIPLPPIGTMIWSTSTTKLYVKNAAGSYLATVALT